jgi:hypothetical protein
MNNSNISLTEGDNLISLKGMEVLQTIARDFPDASGLFLFLMELSNRNTRNVEVDMECLKLAFKVVDNESEDMESLENIDVEALLNVLSDFNFISFVKTLSDTITISINPNVLFTPDIEYNNYKGVTEPSCPFYIVNPIKIDMEELKNGKLVILNEDNEITTMDKLN